MDRLILEEDLENLKSFSSTKDSNQSVDSHSEEYRYKYEVIKTSEPPDLLVKLEEVMSEDFFLLNADDSLSEALCMIFTQGADEIVILDKEGKFSGILSSERALKEVPPSIQAIPTEYQNTEINFRKAVREAYRSSMKSSIGRLFDLSKSSLFLYRQSRVIDALEEMINPYKPYNQRLLIPVLSNEKHILGTVSQRELLSYISRQESLEEITVADFLERSSNPKKIYTLHTNQTLADACYAIDRLPLDCILVSEFESKKLLGMVTRNRIRALTHPLYYYLMQVPLEHIQEPITHEQMITYNSSIQTVINKFFDQKLKFVIAVDQANDSFLPKAVVTCSDVLRFIFLRISGGCHD